MGTVMEAKIKEAFEEWKKVDQQQSKESEMETKGTHNLSQQLLAHITANPGVTGSSLRTMVKEWSPTTPQSYVPAVLKSLFDGRHVRRVASVSEGGARNTFAYYVLTPAEREEARRQGKTKRPVGRPKKPQEAATLDKPARGLPALMPAKRHAMLPMEVGPTTVSISITVGNGTSYSLNLADAKFIYKQLHQIFGAAH